MSVTLEPVQTEEPVELVEPVEEAVPEVEEPIPEVEEVVPEAVQPKKTWTTQGSTKRKSGEGNTTSSATTGSQETTLRKL